MLRLLAVIPLSALTLAFAEPAAAEPLTLVPQTLTEWKAVYGTIEARDRMPARARLSGTLIELSVIEGDLVVAGQELARVVDDKLDFQLAALAAQKDGLQAQFTNASADLQRGEELLKNGSTTTQRVDALRTQVDVLSGQIAALDAQAEVITQQQREGIVLAPASGRVLDVPVARGAVVLSGEPIAVIGGGGIFLRISVPERYIANLKEGGEIRISDAEGPVSGTLSRVYPLIEGGRVVADVEIDGLPDGYIGARMQVRLPVGSRDALMVPATSLVTRDGLDFVAVETSDGAVLRIVVPGQHEQRAGVEMVEILSGLRAGDVVVPADEVAAHD
ncbi:efflux RND transporter periplasmic adaptor subunit [Phaeovulum sp.]|uniref:efflux RND transporter periplasmic adaptor subunit n=1 Tax=Phaeovulum sp. TaxID=2934796 RepID=UPI0035633C9B